MNPLVNLYNITITYLEIYKMETIIYNGKFIDINKKIKGP